MYRVLTAFFDLQKGTMYHKGDTFPCENVPKERINALTSNLNARKRPLIELVEENINKAPKGENKPNKKAKKN